MVMFNSLLCKRLPGRVSRKLRVGWLRTLGQNGTRTIFRANVSNPQLRRINPLERLQTIQFFSGYIIYIYIYIYLMLCNDILIYMFFFWLGISRLASNLWAMGITGDMVPSPAVPHGKESGGGKHFSRLGWMSKSAIKNHQFNHHKKKTLNCHKLGACQILDKPYDSSPSCHLVTTTRKRHCGSAGKGASVLNG